jgi:hypothetical protein
VGRHELIPLDDGERWTAALADVPHGHALTHGFCRAIQLTTGSPTHLYRYEDGRARVVCALAERDVAGHVDVTTPYGFGGFAMSGDCSGFAPAWHDFARERGWVCGYIALNPAFADAGAFATDELWVHTRLYVLDLREPPEKLWARLSQNRRRQLRDWDAVAGRLELDRSRLARFLVDNFSDFFARKGGGPATDLRRETVAAIAALDDARLAALEHDVVAGWQSFVRSGELVFDGNAVLTTARRRKG